MKLSELYKALGNSKIQELVNVFYDKIDTDEILRPMFPTDLTYARLFQYLFLKQIFGGPKDYEKYRGNPLMRKRHYLFRISQREKNRWIELMFDAMHEVGITDSDIVTTMHTYFEKLATKIINTQTQGIVIDTE